MSGQETGGQERARAFNAVGRALPRDRFVSLSERQAVADAVLAELGYGTHRCVRCGQPQAQEDDTCPPCDLKIYREEILELRTDHEGRLRQAEAERDRLRKELAEYRQANTSLQQINTLRTGERDRLRAALTAIGTRCETSTGPSTCQDDPGRSPDGTDMVSRWCDGCIARAALDQSDTSTPQQAADDTHAAGTGRNQTP